MRTKDTIPAFFKDKGIDAVKLVLTKYKNAVEKLEVAETENLVTSNSQIFESGESDGSYSHYLRHHLIPEFKDFSSFKYSDYKVDIKVNGKYAFAAETYTYTLVLAKDKTKIKRRGVKENQEAFENSLLINMEQILSIPFILIGLYFIFRKHNLKQYERQTK
jgi:hypothetical protein